MSKVHYCAVSDRKLKDAHDHGTLSAMIINRADVTSRQVDDSLTIVPLFDGANFAFDVALGMADGDHGCRINRASDRAYFILSGKFRVTVGDEVSDAEAHDLVVIPRDVVHGIAGSGEFLTITAPPFAPENEVPA